LSPVSGRRLMDGVTIRVALVSCSGLLGGLIRETVSALPGVVVRTVSAVGRKRLVRALRRFRPDIIVWRTDDDRMLSEHLEFFGVRHQAVVLAVLGDGADGSIWRLGTERSRLGPLSPEEIKDTVRAVAGER
jgi:hypothetical protein